MSPLPRRKQTNELWEGRTRSGFVRPHARSERRDFEPVEPRMI